jgi:hypothetical protein
MSFNLESQSIEEMIAMFKKTGNQLYDLTQKHPDYIKFLQQKAQEAGINFSEVVGIENAEKFILNQLWNDILNIFSEQDAVKIKSTVGIGLINAGNHRARIEKRNDLYFILINYGLLTFLNQCTKYSIAANEPKYVVFCSEKDPESITSEDINVYYNKLIENYHAHRIPFGPLIVLHKDADSLRVDQLYVKEIFILCHELSHYLLGHLEQRDPNNQLQLEYQADCFAFQLLEEVVKAKRNWVNKKFILLTLIELFKDMQYYQGVKETTTHPQPFSRLLTIVNTFYGGELANAVKKSLLSGENKEMKLLLEKYPDYPSFLSETE